MYDAFVDLDHMILTQKIILKRCDKM